MTCRTSFLIERLTTHGLLVGVDAVVDGLCSLYSERNRSGEQESSHNFYDRHAVNLAELGAYRQLQFQRSADPSPFGRRWRAAPSYESAESGMSRYHMQSSSQPRSG